MDIFQAFVNLAYKQFGDEGFTVISVNFENEIKFNLEFQGNFFFIFYDRYRKIWRYRNIIMTVYELHHFLNTIKANYAFYTTMKVYLENIKTSLPENCWPGLPLYSKSEGLIQLKIGNFLISDPHPVIRFYYKEIYWMLDKTEEKFDLYEFYNRKPIPHLTAVSFKTIDRFIQKI